jgi:biotin carboxyl carrier protein
VDDEVFGVLPGPAEGKTACTVTVGGHAMPVHWTASGRRLHATVGASEFSLDLEPACSGQARGAAAGQGLVRAPMMGQVIAVHVLPGQPVAAGERLATLESMKMEMAISAPLAGVVKTVGCQAQAKVERNQELFFIEA